MSEKKQAHTPGPYRVEGPDEIFGDYNILEPDSCSAVGAVVSNGRDPAEVRANADLFGAAPDLLEHGRFLLARLGEIDWSQDKDDLLRDYMGHVEPAIARFRAALAKARPSQVEA